MARLLTLALLLVFCVGVAQADDVFPPDWRGNFGTVTAGWDFFGPEGLGPRTLLQTEAQLIQANPGGFAEVYPSRCYFNSQVYVHDQLWQRQSVLEVNAGGTLSFALSNYEGGPEKTLLMQITFRPGYGAPMNFDVGAYPSDPGDPPWTLPDTVSAVVLDSFLHDDGWQTNQYGLTFEPNPRFEGFGINFTEYPAFIDQVVIDTWCVPEPASLWLLLCVGAGALTRRRG